MIKEYEINQVCSRFFFQSSLNVTYSSFMTAVGPFMETSQIAQILTKIIKNDSINNPLLLMKKWRPAPICQDPKEFEI